jgi:hypothetical protein
MTSISTFATLLATPPTQVGPGTATPAAPLAPVAPAAPAAPLTLAGAQDEAMPLPSSQVMPAAAVQPEGDAGGAAMRADQVFMARQLTFPRADAASLASAWRAMVGNYGTALAQSELRARKGTLPEAAVAAGQEGRSARPGEPLALAEVWRFTVYAGNAQAQQLMVLGQAADQPPGRRRRARVALRLDLRLADGSHAEVQIEPHPAGVVVEIAAPGAVALARLRALQSVLDQALLRAGVQVQRWTFSSSLAPTAGGQCVLGAAQLTEGLTAPVFRAAAELAVLLPAQTAQRPTR